MSGRITLSRTTRAAIRKASVAVNDITCPMVNLIRGVASPARFMARSSPGRGVAGNASARAQRPEQLEECAVDDRGVLADLADALEHDRTVVADRVEGAAP